MHAEVGAADAERGRARRRASGRARWGDPAESRSPLRPRRSHARRGTRASRRAAERREALDHRALAADQPLDRVVERRSPAADCQRRPSARAGSGRRPRRRVRTATRSPPHSPTSRARHGPLDRRLCPRVRSSRRIAWSRRASTGAQDRSAARQRPAPPLKCGYGNAESSHEVESPDRLDLSDDDARGPTSLRAALPPRRPAAVHRGLPRLDRRLQPRRAPARPGLHRRDAERAQPRVVARRQTSPPSLGGLAILLVAVGDRQPAAGRPFRSVPRTVGKRRAGRASSSSRRCCR